jgi:hypothetical protein
MKDTLNSTSWKMHWRVTLVSFSHLYLIHGRP